MAVFLKKFDFLYTHKNHSFHHFHRKHDRAANSSSSTAVSRKKASISRYENTSRSSHAVNEISIHTRDTNIFNFQFDLDSKKNILIYKRLYMQRDKTRERHGRCCQGHTTLKMTGSHD